MENEPNQHELRIIADCRNCPLRTEGFFCQFAPPILDELSSIGQLSAYPKGAILFWKGQLAQAFFILCSGRVKLGISSTRGRSVVLKIAESGDVLGLSALLLSQPHLVSAETLEPVQGRSLIPPTKTFCWSSIRRLPTTKSWSNPRIQLSSAGFAPSNPQRSCRSSKGIAGCLDESKTKLSGQPDFRPAIPQNQLLRCCN